MFFARLSLAVAGVFGGLSALLIGGVVAAAQLWLHGDEIAYVSYRELNPDIYLRDVGHELTFNVTRHPAYDVAPAWSPDGEWLAFASDRDGRRNIYVMDRIGGNLRRLTDQGGIYTQPRWTVDGQRLVFISLDEAPNGIYSVGLDGSGFQSLIDANNPSRALTLDLATETNNLGRARSPDGSRFAFMTYRNQGWGIYLSQDTSRRDAELLVYIGYPTEAPVWSPDGTRMAYIVQTSGATDIFMIGVDDDSPPRRVTSDRTFEASPTWRP